MKYPPAKNMDNRGFVKNQATYKINTQIIKAIKADLSFFCFTNPASNVIFFIFYVEQSSWSERGNLGVTSEYCC